MGVPGLWEILSPAGVSRSFTHLAVVDGFEKNTSGKRALRLGIDASIWYEHARFSKEGFNPDVRLLFFRLLDLAELPILPLFVFDGRERPKVKRGSKMGKTGSHKLNTKMKELLDVFGMERREARGEAEAELAALNRQGIIDAVLTDDVDAFVFGARTIIRNSSLTLAGNKSNPSKNADGKASKSHRIVFNEEAIRNHPKIGMTRGGMILFALLSGGDYSGGLKGCGPQLAHGLARCGFGDQLLEAYERLQRHGVDIHPFLAQWRQEINQELRTNSSGYLGHRRPSLNVPPDFPDLQYVKFYVNPIFNNSSAGTMRDRGNFNISRAAAFCEAHFDEWGSRTNIIKRYRTLVWEGATIQLLRRAALEADEKEALKRTRRGGEDLPILGPLRPSTKEGVGMHVTLVKKYLDSAPPDPFERIASAFVNRGAQSAAGASSQATTPDTTPLMKQVLGYREHVSTDHLPEYRVEINPTHLVKLANSGIKGRIAETPPKVKKTADPEPIDTMRLWLPVSMMRQVHPGLVQDYEDAEAKKARKGESRASAEDIDATEARTRSSPNRPAASAQSVRKTNPPRRQAAEPSGSQIRSQSFAEPEVFEEVLTNARSSLPQRSCGFIFTFPDPDDPDHVTWGDVSGLHGYDDLVPLSSGIAPTIREEHDSIPVSQPKKPRVDRACNTRSDADNVPPPRRAPARAKKCQAMAVPEAVMEAPNADDGEHLTQFDQFMDKILGFGPSTGTGTKGKARAAPRRKRPRATIPNDHSAPLEDDPASSKRRKTMYAGSEPSAAALAVVDARAFLSLPPLDNALDRSVRRVSVHMLGMSAILDLSGDTDSEDVAHPAAGPSSRSQGKRRAYHNVILSSSQQSRLSAGYEDDVIEISD